MFGNVILYISLIMTIISSIAYFLGNDKKIEIINFARKIFYGIVVALVLLSVYFLINIFTHNFQFTYIWEHSSKNLPGYLLVSSFFAGQAGSFLLWALMFAFTGIVLVRISKKNHNESIVMGFFLLIVFFLLLMLVAKSPFELIWQSYPERNLPVGFIPEDGRGLNPILENFWITIHPPIIFAGYAAMAIPFVLSIAGLLKRNYHDWIRTAIPMTLFASALLGIGLMLGGFWAYETLGWGGFWGWDPVENSSLLPWLASVALIHTLLVQKFTGGLIKTNFILTSITFLLVLYATFLTRSGILGDASVHSFGNPGDTVYVLLIIFQILFLLISFYAINMRIKDITSKKLDFHFSSREFTLTLGSIIVLFSAIIIWIGTSLPIVGEIINQPKSTVDISFYNIWNFPLVIFMLAINGVSLFLNWKVTSIRVLLKKISISTLFAAIATIVIFLAGVNSFGYIVLGFTAFFSIFVNFEYTIRDIKHNPGIIGGHLSHIGIAFLMLGILSTGGYTKSELVHIVQGGTSQVFDYKLIFTGKTQIEKEFKDRQKFKFNIYLKKNNETLEVNPVVYWSTFNEMKAPILEPGILRNLFEDIYVSPRSANFISNIKVINIAKGQSANTPVDTSIKIKLEGYDMNHSTNTTDNNRIKIGAFLSFMIDGNSYLDSIYSTFNKKLGISDTVWNRMGTSNVEVAFTQIIPNQKDLSQSLIVLLFKKYGEKISKPVEVLTLEISKKPFINLVWFGVIISISGFFIAIFRHRNK